MEIEKLNERYVPPGYAAVGNKSGSAVAYVKNEATGFYALCFRGKAGKPAFNYGFKTAENRDRYVGDVLCCSWGYDQTNIDYFEIAKMIGARTVEIRKIAQEKQEIAYLQGDCVPIKGKYIGEPMRKRVNEYDAVRIYSFATASKVVNSQEDHHE